MKGPGFWKHGGYPRGIRPAACQVQTIDCPERKEQVRFTDCLECEKFQVWHEKDGTLKRCHHEYLDLKKRGYYDGTWDDHPENFLPDEFARLQERKRLNEELNREFESERSELKRRAEEIAEDPSYFYDAFGRGEESGKASEEDLEEQEDLSDEEDEEEDF
jgi:hypothetical protein